MTKQRFCTNNEQNGAKIALSGQDVSNRPLKLSVFKNKNKVRPNGVINAPSKPVRGNNGHVIG